VGEERKGVFEEIDEGWVQRIRMYVLWGRGM